MANIDADSGGYMEGKVNSMNCWKMKGTYDEVRDSDIIKSAGDLRSRRL